MVDCLWCKIVEGNAPSYRVAESANFIAFLSIYPSARGHTLIVPKKHSTNFLDFPEYLAAEMIEFSQRVATAVVAAVAADAFNFALNNGKAAGQSIFHTHFHIVPRFESDGMRGPFEKEHKPTPEELKAVQTEIVKHFR